MAHVQCHAYLFLLSIYRVYYMYDLACENLNSESFSHVDPV